MKKKITAILLMLVLCLSLSATAFAVQGGYIIDERGVLSEEDTEDLNAIAANLSAATLVQQNADDVESLPDAQLYTAVPTDTPSRMVDMADVLTVAEETALLSSLDAVSERQQLDVVIVTVNDTGDKTLAEYADDYFDYSGYGFGENHDGVLLLARIADDGTYTPGNCWISTTGYGITAFTDADIQYIGKQITPALEEGDFADAFSQYATLADDLITQAKSDTPYYVGTPTKAPFNVLRSLLIAVIVGLIVAFVVTGIMKAKLKTVRSQSSASNYLKQGSMHLAKQKDMFLYSNVIRTAKPKEINSSGSSSTHTSSSGTTHGGGGF